MGWAYRCNRCRTRNTFRKKLEEYVRPKKCKECGHDRFYYDRERNHRSDYCSCEGYHWTHRRGTTYCIHNPLYQVNVRVGRYGEKLEDVLEDIALREQCPF